MKKKVLKKTWFVCHGGGVVHLVEVRAGDELASGQPQIEEFADKAQAEVRARALGWVDNA